MTQALIQVYKTYNKRVSYQATEVWKAVKTAERLVEQYMIRIETGCTFSSGVAN